MLRPANASLATPCRDVAGTISITERYAASVMLRRHKDEQKDEPKTFELLAPNSQAALVCRRGPRQITRCLFGSSGRAAQRPLGLGQFAAVSLGPDTAAKAPTRQSQDSGIFLLELQERLSFRNAIFRERYKSERSEF